MVGNLRAKADRWCDINAPGDVIEWIRKGVSWEFNTAPPRFVLDNKPLSNIQRKFVDSGIHDLVKHNQ